MKKPLKTLSFLKNPTFDDLESCRKSYFLEGYLTTLIPALNEKLQEYETRIHNLEERIVFLESLKKDN